MSDSTRPDRDRPEPDRNDHSGPRGPLEPFDGSDGHDLDGELRRLFGDDRLGVPVARGAGEAVVAGARRRRRNRMTMAAGTGVLAATAIVFAGVAFAGLGRPTAITPAGPVLSTTVAVDPTPSPSSPASSVERMPPVALGKAVLGPDGFDVVRLGMPEQAVLKLQAGLQATARKYGSQCVFYNWRVVTTKAGLITMVPTQPPGEVQSSGQKPGALPRRSGASAQPTTVDPAGVPSTSVDKPVGEMIEVIVSVREGVVGIVAVPGMTTPQGIGIGSTTKDVLKSYSGATFSDKSGTISVVAQGNPSAFYVFRTDGTDRVTGLTLETKSGLACPS
jgi:hypothetical protein